MSNPNTSSTALTWEDAWEQSALFGNEMEISAFVGKRVFKAGWEAREARVKELEDALRNLLTWADDHGHGAVAKAESLLSTPEVPKQS